MDEADYADYERRTQALAILDTYPRRKPLGKSSGDLSQFQHMGEATAKAIRDAVAPLEQRIAELEARPVGLDYKGIYKRDFAYAKNMGVTHAGSIWVALKDKPPHEPGQPNSGWVLACKRGKDGKDAK